MFIGYFEPAQLLTRIGSASRLAGQSPLPSSAISERLSRQCQHALFPPSADEQLPMALHEKQTMFVSERPEEIGRQDVFNKCVPLKKGCDYSFSSFSPGMKLKKPGLPLNWGSWAHRKTKDYRRRRPNQQILRQHPVTKCAEQCRT